MPFGLKKRTNKSTSRDDKAPERTPGPKLMKGASMMEYFSAAHRLLESYDWEDIIAHMDPQIRDALLELYNWENSHLDLTSDISEAFLIDYLIWHKNVFSEEFEIN